MKKELNFDVKSDVWFGTDQTSSPTNIILRPLEFKKSKLTKKRSHKKKSGVKDEIDKLSKISKSILSSPTYVNDFKSFLPDRKIPGK